MERLKHSKSNRVQILNRRVSFEFHIIESFLAGLVLKGSEIKSIRHNNASIQECFCEFKSPTELYIINMYIKQYEYSTHYSHEPRSQRKLLLQKKELKRLYKQVKTSGITIVPRRLFIDNKGLAKLEICLVKGKKLYDKRESIKARDVKRDMDRKQLI